ncbi:MAG: DsbA family protein [Bacteroidia bacterium]
MELIYLFDPLCGWCYGFGPHLHQFAKQHPDIQYTVLAGGMVTGARVGPLSQIAPYIREGVQRVEQLSGVKFGPHFLQDLHGEGKTHMDSAPPSKAFIIFKKHRPEAAVALAHEIQKVFYADGKDLNLAESYEALCEGYELDFASFKTDFEGMDYQLATRDEFDEVARYGVSGYPSVILKIKEQYFLMAQGFAPAAQLEKTLLSILSTQA